ncbi:MAG: DUF2165 domain-containing protein [Rhodobacteraceae bacterium]|nr:DUF2165 domain-containing protein [Paracoccaceae bacterium]
MFDVMILIAQASSLALIAAWLATGVWDNLRHPSVNETYTAQVLSMARMAQEYPAEHAQVAHRAIHGRALQRLAFRIVVAAELVAALVLWAGVVALLMALAGTATPEIARTIALAGALLFTAVWGAFLVVGNYFSYWFCHEGAQNTHYQMTLWGMANMVLLVAA